LRELVAERGRISVSSDRPPARGLAKLLRRNPTDAERALWDALTRHRRFAGLGFKRQVPVGPFVTDITSFPLRTVIDIVPAHEEAVAAQARAEKRAWLQARNYRIVEVTAADIAENTVAALERLADEIGRTWPRFAGLLRTALERSCSACVKSTGCRAAALQKAGNGRQDSTMQLRNSPERYGGVALTFHWLTVVLVVLGWALGEWGDVFPKGAARDGALFVHMSAGLAIIMLVALRLMWRMVDAPLPPEPTQFGRAGELASRIGHFALYALLIAVTVAGVATQFSRGNALPVFGFTEIVSPWTADRAFSRSVKEVHETLANVLIIAAALHAAAALVHHYLLRDRTLVRMLPESRKI
jgi:cytochrome b561